MRTSPDPALPGVRYTRLRAGRGVDVNVGTTANLDRHCPAVVFVHGGGVDHRWWRHQLPALVAAGIAAVLLDMPGHGVSDDTPLPALSRDQYRVDAEVLADVLTALGLSRPVLVGWSLGGGRIAAGLGTDGVLEGVCAAVVMVGAVIRRPLRSTCIGVFARIPGLLRGHPESFVRLCLQPTAVPPTEVADLVAGVRLATRTALLNMSVALNTADLSDNLRSTRTPVHVVQGACDRVTRQQAARDLARLAHAELTVVPDAGHSPFYTHPHRFNTLLIDLVRRTSPIPPGTAAPIGPGTAAR